MSSPRCIVVGEAALTLQCADAILAAACHVVAVFTRDAALEAWANSKGVPAYRPEKLSEFAGTEAFDYLFSIINGRIIPPEVLAKARGAAINFHDGPLPRYAGFFSTSWAVMNRERQYGVTWHLMTGEIDSGDIACQRRFPVSDTDTAFTLNAKCYEAGLLSFAELIRDIAGGFLRVVKQDLGSRTYFPRWNRPEAACLIPFERSCDDVQAFCRGLDFGPYLNPMGLPKLFWGGAYYAATGYSVMPGSSGKTPGTILRAGQNELVVATADGAVALRGLTRLNAPLLRQGAGEGERLLAPSAETARRVSALHSAVARHENFWVKRLSRMNLLHLGTLPEGAGQTASHARIVRACPAEAHGPLAGDPAFFVSACLTLLSRHAGQPQFSVGLHVPLDEDHRGLFAPVAPLEASVDASRNVSVLVESVRAELAELQKRQTFLLDLPLRYPELRAQAGGSGTFMPQVSLGQGDTLIPQAGNALTILLAAGAGEIVWLYDGRALSADQVDRWSRQLNAILQSMAAGLDQPLAHLSSMSEAELRLVTRDWNQTQSALEAEQRIHVLFEAQARRTPDDIAISFEGRDLTYRQLDERTNRVARYLKQNGARPGSLVAIATDRSIEMVVGLLAILKSGAAYVPIDAAYPRERLSLMLEDSRPCLLLTEARLLERLPATGTPVVRLDRDWPVMETLSAEPLEGGATGGDLAYVIYTSGSTGRPKGVMVTHGNVANFFAGMDQALGSPERGVWLAVTSISFDISVLELFWTLVRGFRVVIAGEDHKRLVSAARPSSARPAGATAFSLFYFAAFDSTGVEDPYRLLMEGAKFADENGFEAVWTPERHFHAFGGLYPNPSVTSAALAGITKRVKIRAGSVVLPLHHPVRVAEEWAFVDRLSGGRTGISFAAGWHQRDFILAPDNYAQAKDVMFREIETVRKLWRGETVNYPDGKGALAEIAILPRPSQAELPVWVTAAGNVETFRMAGERGFNLLTHLLGQSFDQLSEKIAAYRSALEGGGRDPASGKITLMLHTFVGASMKQVRETVRTPFTNYLKSSVDLIKNSPWSFPAFSKQAASDTRPLQLTDLSPEELQTLLDHSFDRYFESSGLFGTVEDCVQIVAKLQAIGVDEVACLVDFGVETDAALASLRLLKEVMERSQPSAAAELDHSLAAQMDRYAVTHLQCTPSMAGMLVAEPATRQALGRLRQLLVGGEALSSKLAAQLLDATPAAIHNMYGPTETTVWSTTAPVSRAQPAAVIGRPIANTQIYLLDGDRQPVPIGTEGEIFIGGLGVARGYWNLPELSAGRFVDDPFSKSPGARMYRTGDLARYLPDGRIEYVGRIDHQVKIRGFRIELGEIENALRQHPRIGEAVVVARETNLGDKALAGYYVSRDGEAIADLKLYLEALLPAVMVPPSLVKLEAMPLTLNGKIDRQALPASDQAAGAVKPAVSGVREVSSPASQLERDIAAVWQEILGLETIGMSESFFDLGAHSILMVQAHVHLKERLRLNFSMIDLFQFPTVRTLAAHLGNLMQPAGARIPAARTIGVDRATARKAALARRPAMGD